MPLYTFVVSPEEQGDRIDKYLTACLGEAYSRSGLKPLFKEGAVLLNDKPAKPSALLAEGDTVAADVPEPVLPDILPEAIPLDILYEDDEVLVVNKARGMVVHPAPGHAAHTLVNAALYHCLRPDGSVALSGINGVLRPGIVHRIDKDTTGSLVLCKTDRAHRAIARQLEAHSMDRLYEALVYGILEEDTLTVDAPIGRDPAERKRMAVRKDGKDAVTHITVLQRFPSKDRSLPAVTHIACRLETGRTHQIRVHLAHLGHPVLGDPVYAGRRKSPFDGHGQYLHAKTLCFTHPVSGERICTEAPLPQDFLDVLSALA